MYEFLEEWKDGIVVVQGIETVENGKTVQKIPRWKQCKEMYRFTGDIRKQNLRSILPGEIIIEFDCKRKKEDRTTPYIAEAKIQARKQIEVVKSYLEEQGVNHYITDHGGLSPHIRINIKGMRYFTHSNRKDYKMQFVKLVLHDCGFKENEFIQLDESLIRSKEKLISLEGQPHWKAKYNGAVEEIVHRFGSGKDLKVQTQKMNDIVESRRMEISFGKKNIKLGDGVLEDMLTHISSDNRDTWVRIAFALRGEGKVRNEDLFPLFHKWSQNSEKYTNEEDCKRVWASIKVDGENNPELVTVGTIYYHAKKNGWKEKEKILTHPVTGAITPSHLPFAPRTLENMYDEGIPDIEWHIWRILPKRGITFFGGTSGSYKTWAGMHLALALSQGEQFLFKFPANKTKVLYLDEENGEISLFKRFQLLTEGHGLKRPFDNLHVVNFSGMKLDLQGHVDILDQYIEEHDIKVIVVDSMVRCMQGQEDKASDVRNVFDALKTLLNKRDELSIVILHHTTKGGKGMDALRGSGDFAAFADIIFMFNPLHKKKMVQVDVVKHRHVALDEFPNMNFEITTPQQGGLNLSLCDSKVGAMAHELDTIKDKMIQYMEINRLVEVRTGMMSPMFRELISQDHNKDLLFEAVRQLVNEGVLSNAGKGMKTVNEPCLNHNPQEVTK